MNRWTVIGAVLLLALIAGAVYRSATSALPVRAAEIHRGEIREYIDERGKTRLPITQVISMPFAARIEPITLVEGDPVKTGDMLAKIVSSDLDDAVAEARAAVERLDAAIAQENDITVEDTALEQAKQFVKSMYATVRAADTRLTASNARYEYSLSNLERVRRLYERNAKSEDDVELADLARVESKVEHAQDALVLEALRAIEMATSFLPTMVSEVIARKGLSRAVLEKQKQEAEAHLRQILTRQRRGVMRSPVDGVIFNRLRSNERFLPAGEELLTVGGIEQLEIESDILSQDVVLVQAGEESIGDEVEIYGPAVGAGLGRGLRGWVANVHPAGFTKMSSLGVEQQRVKVIVRFGPEVLQALRERQVGVDFRVRVRIFTQSKADALIAPRPALFRDDDGGWRVYVIRRGKAQLAPVTVGLMNDEFCEITNGVDLGEMVVVAPENSLRSGDRVRPEQ